MEISDQENAHLLNELSNTLQQPYWDTITVEKDLKSILQKILLKAQKIQETHSEVSLEEAKIQAAAEIFESRIFDHAAVIEFLVENKEYGIFSG